MATIRGKVDSNMGIALGIGFSVSSDDGNGTFTIKYNGNPFTETTPPIVVATAVIGNYASKEGRSLTIYYSDYTQFKIAIVDSQNGNAVTDTGFTFSATNTYSGGSF